MEQGWAAIIAACLGAFFWTFLEYMIHRYMGHDRRFRKTPFGIEHVRHHIEGNYFAPNWKKVLAALIVTLFLIGPAILIAGNVAGPAFVAGLISFYSVYEIAHRRRHTHAPTGPYARWARRHHFYHHFVDGRANHGVTSPIWDIVFGTYRKPGMIKVPRQLCMTWLLDPDTGEVRSIYADTYSIRTR